MRIHFLGATGDVTGSAYHVVTKHASVLVDCGMFQGGKKKRPRTAVKPNSRVANSTRCF